MTTLPDILDRAGLGPYASRFDELNCISVRQLVALERPARAAFLSMLRPFPGHRHRLETWLSNLKISGDEPPLTAEEQRDWRKTLSLIRASAEYRGRDCDRAHLSGPKGPKGLLGARRGIQSLDSCL